MKIKVIFSVINSKLDLNGNRYWAFRYTETETGKQVCATISGGESNATTLVRPLGLEWEEVYYYREELGKREFNRLTRDWPHAGSGGESTVKFIRERLS